MTDVSGSFELRKLVVTFTRSPSGGIVEDRDAITCHLAKITSGAIDPAWVTLDYTNAEARLNTWWTAIKSNFPTWLVQNQFVWYKDGPVFSPADRADGPANPAQRTTTRNIAGTGSASAVLPPQVAMSISKRTSIRKRWGRFYLPPILAGNMDVDGRLGTAVITTMMTATVAMFNGWRADGLRPVVFSRGLSAHLAKSGALIAAHDATAYEILTLAMDNNLDVMRSRRYSAPTSRTVTNLT